MENDQSKIGDGPLAADYHDMMVKLAGAIDRMLNGEDRGKQRTVGFVLLVFPFGEEPGRCNYISNAGRDQVLELLREQTAFFENLQAEQGARH